MADTLSNNGTWTLPKPYLLFTGAVETPAFAKTAFGVLHWSGEDVVGQCRLPGSRVDLGIESLSPKQAADAGARSLLIGVAPMGGQFPQEWTSTLVEALSAGLDIVSGLHTDLYEVPPLAQKAQEVGRRIHQLRHGPKFTSVGTGRPRSGKRLLTVGTDCAVGKKYTALSLTKELKGRGIKVDFRATGQTGIMISGAGLTIDSVVADFVSGAAEAISPAAGAEHWDIIEGQGSLFHPGYASVTLGLVHGSQPDAMVLCHQPSRKFLEGYDSFAVPNLREAIQIYEQQAQLTNPSAKVVAVSVYTEDLSPVARQKCIGDIEDEVSLPCCDPLIHGVKAIADQLAVPL